MATRRPKISSALAAYLDEAGQLPRDVLLGTLGLYTISDGEYSLSELTDEWVRLGLPAHHLPVATKPVDAFKRATTEVDDFEYPMPDHETTKRVAHILVRDVDSNNEVIIRHLVREIRDSNGQRLTYAKIGTATFYRPVQEGSGRVRPGSERFKLTIENAALEPAERVAMQALVDEVNRRYDRYTNYLDGQKIRSMVRNFLFEIGALQVKPSVYFVHVSRTDDLEKLKVVVDDLGQSSLHLLPIIDMPSQRAMVVEAFQQEAVAALEDLVKEINRIRGSRKSISSEAYSKVKQQYDATLARTREYSRLLGSVRSLTEGAEEVAQAALAKMQKEMLDG